MNGFIEKTETNLLKTAEKATTMYSKNSESNFNKTAPP